MNARDYSSFGYRRVAAVTPELRVGDPAFNAGKIVEAAKAAFAAGASVAVFPELSITGYTCGDLFFQTTLRHSAVEALLHVASALKNLPVAVVVGLPLAVDGRLFNCAALIAGGAVHGIVPKTFLPTSQEYYEERWFSRASALERDTISLGDMVVPIGPDLLFEIGRDCRVGIEICEDLWTVEPPSGRLSLAGANLILNPSASDELLGKAAYRAALVRQQSARCLAAYAYAGAGPWESSTDLVFSGAGLLVECGQLLAEGHRFDFETSMAVADFDFQRIEHERLTNSSFSAASASGFRRIPVALDEAAGSEPVELRRRIVPRPFVPEASGERASHCQEIFSIQATGLARRLAHTGSAKAVLGLSGGLDSTLAALVCIRALATLGRKPEDLLAVVMPGLGSTKRTQSNALALAAALGAETREISISRAAGQHLEDIGHPPDSRDATYENAQARERTQILMDLANQVGGIVVGTGDLSESALGWCTFNGDHMSMYHVNSGVPKTLVKHLVTWCAEEQFGEPVRGLLLDIVATPISPELLPLDAGETLVQKTEETVGPYDLHDFFLFQMVRHGFGPAKIVALAELAFEGRFLRAEICQWLGVFCTRFFANQFKRSSMPDGPKVGTVALSPRGDWRMPSDASAAAWLAEIKTLSAR
jgi:NAD+ synthase (glutamine-hydrolysing)